MLPVVAALAADAAVPVSIDTTQGRGRRAPRSRAGATIVNDVSGGTADPDMLGVVADAGAALVVMHMQGEPRTMQHAAALRRRRARGRRRARAARVDAARRCRRRADALLADPGIGFGKTAAHNLALLARAARRSRRDVGRAAARRRVAQVVPRPHHSATTGADERDDATLATTVWWFTQGAALRARPRRRGVATRGRAARRRSNARRPRGWRHDYRGCAGGGRRVCSPGSSAGSSRTGSAPASGPAGSPATTARCGARKS